MSKSLYNIRACSTSHTQPRNSVRICRQRDNTISQQWSAVVYKGCIDNHILWRITQYYLCRSILCCEKNPPSYLQRNWTSCRMPTNESLRATTRMKHQCGLLHCIQNLENHCRPQETHSLPRNPSSYPAVKRRVKDSAGNRADVTRIQDQACLGRL